MNNPTDFVRWCQHYGYNPDTEQARADYQRYLDNLEMVAALFSGRFASDT
ncbi:hypothetical protein [Alkalilimnicola ehrlichii]|nr:hypothetical protein [Alkalilimnicola ehrlichii]